MPVRKATPEETQAFWGKPVLIFGQKRPNSSKENLKSSDQKPPQKKVLPPNSRREPERARARPIPQRTTAVLASTPDKLELGLFTCASIANCGLGATLMRKSCVGALRPFSAV